MKDSKSHNIYRSDFYPNITELLIKARFWICEWIIFYLMFTTLISVIYFLNSQNWTYTFLSILLSLTIVFSVLLVREIKKKHLYKELLSALEKRDKIHHSEIFKKMVDELTGTRESDENLKLKRTKERLERIQGISQKTWKYSPFEEVMSTIKPAFYNPYSQSHNPSLEKSEKEIILILLSMDKNHREELFSLAQSLEKKITKK